MVPCLPGQGWVGFCRTSCDGQVATHGASCSLHQDSASARHRLSFNLPAADSRGVAEGFVEENVDPKVSSRSDKGPLVCALPSSVHTQ